MNHTSYRLMVRLIVPAIALGALALTGQPIHGTAHGALSHADGASAAGVAAPQTRRPQAADEDAAQRKRVAFHLRWSLTLPAAPRLPSIGVVL